MGYKVLIPQDITQCGKDYLLEKGYEIKIGKGSSVQDIVDDVIGCDAILARTASFPREVIEAESRLKVIARHGVGYDNIDIRAAEENGVYVTNTPDANADTVAEHTIGLIIAIAKNLVKVDKALRDGYFEIRNKEKGSDIAGKTLSIIGLGRIGKIVARKAMGGLDMNVIAYDPFIQKDAIDQRIRLCNWEEAFSEADFVSLHLPATESTKKIVSKKEFEMMKNGAYLINVARGELVNEEELIIALKRGNIKGAALDVFEPEPPSLSSPLFKLDNVIVTPHIAALTNECMDRMGLQAAICIDEVLKGEKPKWAVNHPCFSG